MGSKQLSPLTQIWAQKRRSITAIESIDAAVYVVLRSHCWINKATEPKGQIVETATIACGLQLLRKSYSTGVSLTWC